MATLKTPFGRCEITLSGLPGDKTYRFVMVDGRAALEFDDAVVQSVPWDEHPSDRQRATHMVLDLNGLMP